MTDDSPPVARIDPAPSWSPIWLVPLAAAALAGILGWQSWGALGTSIEIAFEQGHGIKTGDTLRYKGIVAGEVTAMTFADRLGGVSVEVTLDSAATSLAVAGSRFWIVRPRFGWTGITGLDTLIGDRYLGVIPGDGPERRQFVGLDQAPIPDALLPGLDIKLEGTSRGSIVAGSPVTYRRIHVGSVLSVSLASDSRSVEILARIRQEYSALIQEGTRFWETSGVGLDVGLTGAAFHLESLESLVRGGVSLATPTADGARVSTGHRFDLDSKPESAWLAWRPAVPIGHSLLPPGTSVPHPRRVQLSWRQGTLWSGDEVREGWGLPLSGALLAPADLLTAPEKADEASAALEVAGLRLPVESAADIVTPGLATRSMPEGAGMQAWPRAQQRVPTQPEDCLVVADPGSAPLSIAPGGFDVTDDGWHVDRALPVDKRWHGAPVLARKDGRLIGILLVESGGARVVPLPRLLP